MEGEFGNVEGAMARRSAAIRASTVAPGFSSMCSGRALRVGPTDFR